MEILQPVLNYKILNFKKAVAAGWVAFLLPNLKLYAALICGLYLGLTGILKLSGAKKIVNDRCVLAVYCERSLPV